MDGEKIGKAYRFVSVCILCVRVKKKGLFNYLLYGLKEEKKMYFSVPLFGVRKKNNQKWFNLIIEEFHISHSLEVVFS